MYLLSRARPRVKIGPVFKAVLVTTALAANQAIAGIGASVSIQAGQPSNILPGEVTTLSIVLSNNNESEPVTNVAFSNSLPGVLPDGLKIAGPPTYECFDPTLGLPLLPGVGTLTANIGDQSISLSGGTIPQRDAAAGLDGLCTILLPVTAETSNGAAASYSYTIDDGAVTGTDPNPVANAGSVSQSINVLPIQRPTISKSFSSGIAILGGGPNTLTIRINNPNPSLPLTNFSIEDAFPTEGAGGAIIEVASPTGFTANCPGGAIPSDASVSPGDTTVQFTGGTVGASSFCEIEINVVARHTNGDYETSNLTNRIDANSQFSNDLGISAINDATANIRARSPLNVSKSFSPTQLADGETGTLTITFTNSSVSGNDLTVTGFSDSPIDGALHPAPDEGLKVNGPVAVSCPGGTPGTYAVTADNEGIVQTSNTIIGGGSNCTLTVPIIAFTEAANTPVSYTNQLPEGAVVVDTAGVVSQPRSASILVADTLRVTKQQLTSSPRPGTPVRYRVTVENWSISALTDVRIADTLPTNLTFLTGTIGSNDYTPVLSGTNCVGLTVNSAVGDPLADVTIGTVPMRSSSNTPGRCNVDFYAMVDPNAPPNTSTGNSLNPGSVCTNNGAGFCNGGGTSSGNSPVVAGILAIDKRFLPSGPLPEGSITRVRIALQNFSADPLTSVTIADTLPVSGSVQMQIASPANAANNCGGTLSAAPGTTAITLNNGTIPARANAGTGAPGECSIEVDVTGAAGTYSNLATASGQGQHADGGSFTAAPVQDTANFTFTSILSAGKSFDPGSVSSGGTSTARIRLVNTGPVPILNVTVNDPLPTGMVVASPSNAYTTCGGASSITAVAGASNVTMTGADVAAGRSCDLLFDVVATGTSDWTNTIPVGGIEAVGSGVINQAPVSGTLTHLPSTGLLVSKTTNPSSLTFPGQTSRLTITLTNGDNAVSNVALSDYFTVDGTATGTLNGMVLSSDPMASTTCSGGLVDAAPGGTEVSLSLASIPANNSCTVEANITSTAIGGVTNIIPIAAVSTNEGITNSGEATTSLSTQTNLGVSKQFTPTVIKINERSTLRVTLYNPTPGLATDLSLTDTFPANLEIAPGAVPTSTCTGASVSAIGVDQLEITGGSLPAANGAVPSSCYVEVDVTSAAEGSYVNTIPADDLTGVVGGIAASNPQPASATLQVRTPVEIHKALAGRTLDVGNPAGFTTGRDNATTGTAVTLEIALRNPNSIPLTEVSLTDILPTGLVVAPVPNASTSCGGGLVTAPGSATSITLSDATLAANASCTVSVRVLSNVAGIYRNEIPASAVRSLEGVSNEEATVAEIIYADPPRIGKEFSPAVIPPGGISRLTLVIDNDNPAPIQLTANLIDTLPTLPGPMVIANPANITSSCGAVTANPGAGQLSLANGSTIPAGGCSLSVDVTASVVGAHNNNIPAGDLRTNAGDNIAPANAALIVSTQGFISGRVFQDNGLSPDGVYTGGTDTPLPGEAIELRDGTDCSAPLLESATTDSQGNYLFIDLAPGNYSVCQPSQPVDTSNGQTTAGSIVASLGSTGTAGAASNPTANSSEVVGIVLNGDGTDGATSGSIDNNFAELVLSSIAGTVFLDLNNNGEVNGSDTGIAGQTIELLDNTGSVVASTTTDADGNYLFTDLVAGTYSVRQPAQPAGTSSGMTSAGTVENGGTAGTASAPATTPSLISDIVLPTDTHTRDNNFGEIPNSRTISGKVFLDFNDSGSEEAPDYGLPGQIIELSGVDANGAVVPTRQATTDADGIYVFENLPAGTYTLTQLAQPADTANGQTVIGNAGGTATDTATTPSQISGVTLGDSLSVAGGYNFAELPNAGPDLTISKSHTPANFVAGTDTGYFTLVVSNIGAVATSGTISITDTLPAGMTFVEATGEQWSCSGGGNSVTCTSDQVLNSGLDSTPLYVRVAVAAAPPSALLTNQAEVSGGGELPGFTANNSAEDTVAIDGISGPAGVASVSGTVWADANLDAILDTDEKPLRSWRVELLLGGVVIATTATDSDGQYRFADLAPGSGYAIQFRDPINGDTWGPGVTNEQGLPSTPGVRDDDTAPVIANNGNPAGATPGAAGLEGLVLFAGDLIIEQSLAMDPELIPQPAHTIPTLPWPALALLALLLIALQRRANAGAGV